MIREIYRQELINNIESSVSQSNIMAGDVKTAYLSSGSVSEQPIILLHGGGAGAVTWYPTIGAVSKYFHVIAPDIVGYGESDKPNAIYDRAYFSNWLKDLLVSLNIPKAHIVGSSQGGAIALQFALDNPELVDKLILVNSGALGAKPSFKALFSMVWMNNFPCLLADQFNSRFILFNPDNRDPNHSRYSVEVIKGEGGKNAFRQGRGAAVSEIPKDLLNEITNDTLIIWGEEDQFFSIEHGEAAAKRIANAKFSRIQRAGHLPQIDQPKIFNKTLIEFLLDNEL